MVTMKSYRLWHLGPWDLPTPGKTKSPLVIEEPKTAPQPVQVTSTKNIIDKNLFDPERGASRTKEAEANSLAMQRLRSMILLGTAVLGNSRYAILQERFDPRLASQKSQTGQQGTMRLKSGDTLEGFKLSEVRERSVVFTKGTSRVELSLDYFRKVDEGLKNAPGPVPPRQPLPPRLPRRGISPSG